VKLISKNRDNLQTVFSWYLCVCAFVLSSSGNGGDTNKETEFDLSTLLYFLLLLLLLALVQCCIFFFVIAAAAVCLSVGTVVVLGLCGGVVIVCH
jgi:uncharacterized membrane protein